MKAITLVISMLLPVYMYVLIGTNAVMITAPLLIVTALIAALCSCLIVAVLMLSKGGN